jgi:hypothetical protein
MAKEIYHLYLIEADDLLNNRKPRRLSAFTSTLAHGLNVLPMPAISFDSLFLDKAKRMIVHIIWLQQSNPGCGNLSDQLWFRMS